MDATTTTITYAGLELELSDVLAMLEQFRNTTANAVERAQLSCLVAGMETMF